MFHFDNGLFLTRASLAVDVRRRQPRSFVSHAHTDHIARHELALATPTTCRLYQHRLGAHHRVREMPFGEPLDFGSLRLTALPAGHCLGSAMLLADDGDSSLLYTGDFKLGPSATAEPAELPHADVLVMESTFGLPRYRMPPRDTVIDQLLSIVHAALADGKTPVIHAYPLGKSQEVTKILTDATASASCSTRPSTRSAKSTNNAACRWATSRRTLRRVPLAPPVPPSTLNPQPSTLNPPPSSPSPAA